METNSTTDFEQLEQLLRTKRINELSEAEKAWIKNLISEEEYISMSMLYSNLKGSGKSVDIEPTLDSKYKLDMALNLKNVSPTFLQLRMPVYQSVALAILVFCIGLFTNYFSSEPLIVQRTVHVVKYVPKEVIREVRVPIMPIAQLGSTKVKFVKKADKIISNETVESIDIENPFFAKQQEIALNNVQRVLDQSCGTSMGSDTLLQKMMVTIY